MAGILSSKERVMDTVMTQAGKKQLASGKMKIEFVSFSDSLTFYQRDAVSGSDVTMNRPFLEAGSFVQDQVTFETDELGQLQSYISSDLHLIGDKIFSGSTSGTYVLVTGSNSINEGFQLLSSSLQNFNNLQIIGSLNPFQDDASFSLSKDSHRFAVSDRAPFVADDISVISVNDIVPILHDPRFSRVNAFQYLPPVNKRVSSSNVQIANFPKLNSDGVMTLRDLMQSVSGKQKVQITFPTTSPDNNLICQFFENSMNSFNKLDMFEFGEFHVGDSIKTVYFIGKTFIDDNGQVKFVNIFTLIFD